MRYVMLDRVTEVVPGERGRGIKCVTLTDEILHDHFPDFPVFPGALVVEAAAQLAGLVLEMGVNQPHPQPVSSRGEGSERAHPSGAIESGKSPLRAILAQIDKTKFYRPVEPGDTMELEARVKGMLEGAARVDVEANVRGERSMRGSLTFVLRQIDSERVHEQRRYLYRLWTRGLGKDLPIP